MKRSIELRRKYAAIYNLTPKQKYGLSLADLEQLEMCVDDEARRILLGVSNQTPSMVLVPDSVHFHMSASWTINSADALPVNSSVSLQGA